MSAERWFKRCQEVLDRIQTTQLAAITQAAELIVEAAKTGGGVHFYDTGHCSREPIHRAGGLCMLSPLQFSVAIDSRPAPKREQQVAEQQRARRHTSDERLAVLAMERSALTGGDVLLVSSVSGRSAFVVELVEAARRAGVKVVAITNVTYSSAVESAHSSEKRLFEVADVVIDNCGVIGDAVLNMEGVDTGVAPTSGVAFCYVIWAIVAEVVAQMLARGLQPQVYRSINLPDGEEFNARAEAVYRDTGV